MGAMGRYIDALTHEERDRLIAGQGWARQVLNDGQGNRCLIGNARCCDDQDGLLDLAGGIGPEYERLITVGNRFDWTTERFGLERVVRAIKLRAAKLNGSDAETIRKLMDTPAVREGVVG